MRFNLGLILRGKPIISLIEKNKKSNRINVELDRYGNKSALSFDSICFESFAEALGVFSGMGEVSYSPSESCRGQVDLGAFFLDLSEDKRFSVRLDLADVRGSCGLIMRSGSVQISLCFSEAQLKKIMDKFDNAVKAKEALARAEKEMIIRSERARENEKI